MNRSLDIGTYAGIPVRIHWTFGFLILFVVYTAYTNNLDLVTSLNFLLYIIILFLCVTLHEFGHALMARKYGVHTGEILLTPIGGIAKMGRMSPKPKHELLISLAGPFVNLCLAFILGGIISFFLDSIYFPIMDDYEIFNHFPDMVRLVFLMNVVLFTFNLIPAYPMDGGRVLRSLIGFWTSFERATIIATTIGMILAVLFIIAAIYYSHPTLGFIGVFIFIMARAERKVALKNAFLGKPIRSFIKRDFTKVYIDQNLSTFYPIIHDTTGIEKNFIVFDTLDNLVGTLPELFILEAEKLQQSDLKVGDYMRSKVGIKDVETSIVDIANLMNEKSYYVIAITENDQIIGTVDRIMISELFKRK